MRLFKTTFYLLAISLVALSCRKEGCTDESATNYNPEARKNTFCIYKKQIEWDQKEDNSEAMKTGIVEVRITPVANGKRFYVNGTYEDDQSRKLTMNRFKYYVSNVLIANNKTEKQEVAKVELIDYDTAAPFSEVVTQYDHIILGRVEVGTYSRLFFGCGVDPALNEEYLPNNYPNDHPLNVTYNNMDWTWETRYKFTSIEGKIDTDSDGSPDKAFFMHTGFNDLYRQVLLSIGTVEVKPNARTIINLELDILKVFDGLDIATKEGQSHSSGEEQKGYSATIQTNLANNMKFVDVEYE